MRRQGQTWDELDRQPHGTLAAYQRHRRRGERQCYACLQANARARVDQQGGTYIGPSIPDPRPVTNGLPPTAAYRWRERRYPWAQRVLADAEARYGTPEDDEEAIAS
jgi:hypothetical protein